MRNKFILSAIFTLFLVNLNQDVFACHAIQLDNVSGVINGNVLEINGTSNSATCGCGNYSMQVEIVCANQTFGGTPSYFSTMPPKVNCVAVAYPTLYVPLSGLCPGTPYKWRVREQICQASQAIGPWSSTFTFTTPGTPLPPATLTASSSMDTLLTNNGVVCSSAAITGFAVGSCGTTLYSWNNGLGNGQTKVVSPTVTTTYTVTGTDACSGATSSDSVTIVVAPYLNTFFTQTTCPGDTVDLLKSLPPESIYAPITFVDSVREPVRDFSTGIGKINVSGVNTATISTGTIASVCFTITHTRNSNLEIRLRCPSGSLVDLSIGNGGTGSNYTNVCMDESGTQMISTVGNVTPITGTYIPHAGGFGALNGCNTNGLWTLEIYDNTCDNEGELINWNITFNDEQTSVAPVFNWNTTDYMIDTSMTTTHVFPQETTTYILSSVLENCTFTQTYEIVVHPKLIEVDSTTGYCTGESVMLNATGANTYTWSPPAYLSDPNIANPIASSPTSTTYYVTGTDANNCTYFDSTQVFVSPVPVVDAGPDVNVCYGSSVQLNASGGNAYQWYNPSIQYLDNTTIGDPLASPIVNTKFYVEVSDFGCTNIDSVLVTVLPSPSVDAGLDQSICDNGSVTLNATGSASSYQWSPATGLSNTTTLNPVASPSVTTTYYLEGADLICSYIDEVTIYVDPAPVVTIGSNHGPNPSICTNDQLILQGTGGGTYSWTPAAAFSDPNIANPTVVSKFNGSYTLTVTDPASGCQTVETIFLQLNSSPLVDLGQNISICFPDNSTQLNAVIDDPNHSYSWNNAGTLNNPNILNPTATISSSTTYTFTATNPSNGCTTSNNVIVTLAPGPITSPNITTVTSCFDGNDGTADVTASGGTAPYSYTWNPASPNSSSGVATGLSPGFYIITVEDFHKCKLTTSVIIEQPPAMEIEVEAKGDTCGLNNGNLTVSNIVNGNGPYSYLWTNTDSTQTASNLSTGYYGVTVTDSKGCTKSDNVFVPLVGSPISASYTASTYHGTTPLEVNFLNTSLNGTDFHWNFANGQTSNDENTGTIFPNSGEYQVLLTVTNDYCVDTISTLITVLDALIYEIPNVFTPNGDGKNDVFTINGQGMSSFHGIIYNRWGRKVYEWEDPIKGWDGQGSEDGVYYFVLTFSSFVDPEGIPKKENGHVTLIR
ncbi:MAG: gliding motility-associated C-terminal domain-containing protein [Bacteroidota bacterium]|nr:gliding motility-associated C-terminal domain-containing protein [Bacteroidota bacterium]